MILGVSRSGTTLLKEILDHHPDVAIPPESYFVDAEGIVRAKQFGPLTDESMARHLAEIGVGE